MNKIELLAPCGNIKKLKTALYFGADAVYFAGKDFGLRAYAGNFSHEEIERAIALCHNKNKKAYVTVNIFAQNKDFGPLGDYLAFLEDVKADGVIVSDAGVISFIKKRFPKLNIHLSTQANTINKYAVEFWKDIGVSRVVLARELSVDQIKEISDYVKGQIELEAFAHGAMCIAYSGRCLLSTYLTGRDSNRGECVQACRWEYRLTEVNRPEDQYLTLTQDSRGSYILNSKDLCTLPFLDKLMDAGVFCFKIEGRMKSEYYIAAVVNAYRKRLDDILNGKEYDPSLYEELNKVKHRYYTDGFYLNKQAEMCYNTSIPDNGYKFIALVLGYDEDKGAIVVEQRNRFRRGDTLEILSPSENHNRLLKAEHILDEDGNMVEDCKLVQQKLYIKSELKLNENDILRKRRD
ncbi:MAG: peptidase U32 family protein [Christensenellales bacterium]|mgnify:CR=1 FL=1|jgi:putative protease|nr:U32 family peptidase [Clostridiales bacterium]